MAKKQSGIVDDQTPMESLQGQQETHPANGDTPPKPEETKAEKFRRLINQRLPMAEKYLRLVANLGNSKVYESTKEQREKVQMRISEAAAAAYNAFEDDASPGQAVADPI